MKWWPDRSNDSSRLRAARWVLGRCGTALLGCLTVVAYGWWQGIYGLVQVPICFVVGLFWAWCMFRSWVSAFDGPWISQAPIILFVPFVNELGFMANPPLTHDVPFLPSLFSHFTISICYLGCTLTSTFLTLWLFRDIFVSQINAALKPERLVSLAS